MAPDLDTASLLANLARLNAARSREEAAAKIRWLRSDYQAPRHASGATSAKLDLSPFTQTIAPSGLPRLPKDRGAQTVMVLQALETAPAPLRADDLARRFRGGARNLDRVEAALLTLCNYGRVSLLQDGRYLARRPA